MMEDQNNQGLCYRSYLIPYSSMKYPFYDIDVFFDEGFKCFSKECDNTQYKYVENTITADGYLTVYANMPVCINTFGQVVEKKEYLERATRCFMERKRITFMKTDEEYHNGAYPTGDEVGLVFEGLTEKNKTLLVEVLKGMIEGEDNEQTKGDTI